MLPSSATPPRTSHLQELQRIWDEIGESYDERDKMLLEIEQGYLAICSKKIEETRNYRDELKQRLDRAERDIASLMPALGVQVAYSRIKGPLKEQISTVDPVLEGLLKEKTLRFKEVSETLTQIADISSNIAGNDNPARPEIDETDLTERKLDELRAQLQDLCNTKNARLQEVNSHISDVHELSEIMSFDFLEALSSVHKSLTDASKADSKSISDDTLAGLANLIESRKNQKHQRLLKLQDLGTTMQELWNRMETPMDERTKFDNISRLQSVTADDALEKGCLSLDIVREAEDEVKRLNAKSSKMEELVFNKRRELEEICRGGHMDVNDDAARQSLVDLIDSGKGDLSDILAIIDGQIENAKEEVSTRKEILEKIDKWRHAKEEEKWLDDYEKDENRYTAVKGAHKNFKRAEKARSLISKIPMMIDALTTKLKAWENERGGVAFLYNKKGLLEILKEDNVLRAQREEEKRQFREQKRQQRQLAPDKEAEKKPLGQS